MINRRQLLKITDAGALSFATGGQGSLSAKPSAYAQVNTGSEFVPDLYIFLTARLLMGSAIVPIMIAANEPLCDLRNGATIDRLRHGAYTVVLEGKSYRSTRPISIRNSKELQIKSNTKKAKESYQ